ncbi:transcriptional activator somA-like [Scyliorhinus canicula]|uniref:transcriptional activator somA-like n=1 Tax=Scyliorhinus canicula TaxID=7830 RepID=UPI0018F563C6|nr:transcriptional activator somA-like [Scyliorhinus canicula]
MLILNGLRHCCDCERRQFKKKCALEVEKQENKLIVEELEGKATEFAKTKFHGEGKEIRNMVYSDFETQQNNSAAGMPSRANPPVADAAQLENTDTGHPTDSSTHPENQPQIPEEGQNTNPPVTDAAQLENTDTRHPSDSSTHPENQSQIEEGGQNANPPVAGAAQLENTDTRHPSDSSTHPENQSQIEEGGQNANPPEAGAAQLENTDTRQPADSSTHPENQSQIEEERQNESSSSETDDHSPLTQRTAQQLPDERTVLIGSQNERSEERPDRNYDRETTPSEANRPLLSDTDNSRV